MPAHKLSSKNKLIPLISLSSFILILLLLLALMLPSFKWSSHLDNSLFQLAASMLSASDKVDEIQIIHLPEDVFSDPQQAQQLIQLIKKVSAAKASAIGLMGDILPMRDKGLNVPASSRKSKHKKSSRSVQATGIMSQLADTLGRYNVSVSLNRFSHLHPYQTQINISQESGYQSAYLNYTPDVFLPFEQQVHLRRLNTIYPYDILPVDISSANDVNAPLIWWNADNKTQLVPAMSLALLAKHIKSGNIIWRQAEGVDLQSRFIETGIRSRYYYVAEVAAEHRKKISSLSLSRALQANQKTFKNKIVLMGNDFMELAQLQHRLSSLLSDNVYITPSWLFVLSQGLLLALFVYLIFIPGFHHNSGYILTLLFVLLATVAQYSLLLSQQLWLPLSGFYLYLILGHLVIHFSIRQQYKINRFKQQSYNAFWKLGEYQFYQGDYDKAFTSLTQCKTNDDVLALLYDIGQNYERRRQYDRAMDAYKEIGKRQKNYLDIKKRLQTLQKVSDVQNDGISGMQSADTLVLQDTGLELPQLGRYKIEKELGRGAMGVVYLGKDPKINRQVAIKTLNYSLFNREEINAVKQRFYREAEAAGRLNHPNIVTVYDLGEEDDFSFIAMDYVQGKSLGEYTRSDKLLAVDEVLRIAIEVAETLDYAHAQNIVHRDIKPSNIMYNPDTGQIKITDFGIARITDNVKTRTGSFMGSPSYMSPEQMTAQHVDGTSDIYALGVSMYQLLTGQLPFVADSLGNLAYKITHEKHRPIREVREDLPSFITRIINKALQKNPQKRYQTGKEMAQAMKRHLSK